MYDNIIILYVEFVIMYDVKLFFILFKLENKNNSIIKNMSLILIGAHPKKIEYDKGELIHKHFWGEKIEEIIHKENLINPIIHTIDILPGGTYQQDIFNNQFVKEHENTYSQIYLIDCGGIWYVLQSLDISDIFAKSYNSKEIIELREILRLYTIEELNELIKDLILKLYSMLKPNGICVLSKFTNTLFKETFTQLLNELELMYEIDYQQEIGIIIIIRKVEK